MGIKDIRNITKVKNIRLTKEIATGITGVLQSVMIAGKAEDEYKYSDGKDTHVVVKGYWREGNLCIEVSGLVRPGEAQDEQ